MSDGVFYPPLRLPLRDSETGKVRYYASVTRQFGKGARQALYLEPHVLPIPLPKEIEIMVYLEKSSIRPGSDLLIGLHQVSVHDETVRYDGPEKEEGLNSVYFPRTMFDSLPPEQCFLAIDFC